MGKRETKVVFEQRRFAYMSQAEKDSIITEVLHKADELWADRSTDALLFLDRQQRWISGTKVSRQRRLILVLDVELPNQCKLFL